MTLHHSLVNVALLFALASPAAAQVRPHVHGGTLTTTPAIVIPANPLRRKLDLQNPNASIVVAYCPVGPNRDTGAPIVCAVHGAGSITLQPGDVLSIDFASGAWYGIAATPKGANYSFVEFAN
jgi:hypothetical protein